MPLRPAARRHARRRRAAQGSVRSRARTSEIWANAGMQAGQSMEGVPILVSVATAGVIATCMRLQSSGEA
eukprot:7838799-Alexandrium_andersonii.AAC.1